MPLKSYYLSIIIGILFFDSYHLYAQTDTTIKGTHIISISPVQLLDVSQARIAFFYEYDIFEDIGLQVNLSCMPKFIEKEFNNSKEGKLEQFFFYEIRPEIKYYYHNYFRRKVVARFFTSIEAFYMSEKSTISDGYYELTESEEIHFTHAKHYKIKMGMNLKFGWQLINNGFQVEPFIGLGFVNGKEKYYDIIDQTIENNSGHYFFTVDYTPLDHYIPLNGFNGIFGIKLGYAFRK